MFQMRAQRDEFWLHRRPTIAGVRFTGPPSQNEASLVFLTHALYNP
jgi:hypothetical protein